VVLVDFQAASDAATKYTPYCHNVEKQRLTHSFTGDRESVIKMGGSWQVQPEPKRLSHQHLYRVLVDFQGAGDAATTHAPLQHCHNVEKQRLTRPFTGDRENVIKTGCPGRYSQSR
jgi:hypothetical protein